MSKITFSRNMDIYTIIDNIQDYELTNCIAYEMAIRNKELLKLLYDLHFCTSKEDEDKIRKTLNNNFFFNTNCINYFNRNFHFMYANLFATDLDIELIDEKEIKTNYLDESNDKNSVWKFTQHSRSNIPKEENLNNEFTGFMLQTNKSSLTEYIVPNFSRPLLSTNKETKVFFEINPQLPIKENLSYLEYVLSSLSKVSKNDKVYVNSDINDNLIANFLQKKEDLIIQKEANNQVQSLRSKRTKSGFDRYRLPKLTLQNILANQFLIYDYITYKSQQNPKIKLKTMYSDINDMINNFIESIFLGLNADKVFSSQEQKDDILYDLKSSIDDKTMRKYYSNMKDFIEEKKYISLICS